MGDDRIITTDQGTGRMNTAKKGGLKMQFEQHLPETSCTVTMSWKVD
jgi:hypothetical protein